MPITKNILDCSYYTGENKIKSKWSFMFRDQLYLCFGFHDLSHQFIVENEAGKLEFISIKDMENIKPLSKKATLIYLLEKANKALGVTND